MNMNEAALDIARKLLAFAHMKTDDHAKVLATSVEAYFSEYQGALHISDDGLAEIKGLLARVGA